MKLRKSKKFRTPPPICGFSTGAAARRVGTVLVDVAGCPARGLDALAGNVHNRRITIRTD